MPRKREPATNAELAEFLLELLPNGWHVSMTEYRHHYKDASRRSQDVSIHVHMYEQGGDRKLEASGARPADVAKDFVRKNAHWLVPQFPALAGRGTRRLTTKAKPRLLGGPKR